MSYYTDGYRDGLRIASLENAETVFEKQCDEIERELARLAVQIYRRRPAQCKRESSEYFARSQYYAGLCDGYNRARREKKSEHER